MAQFAQCTPVIDVGKHDLEFVTAQSTDFALVADNTAKSRCNLLQQFVAGWVAKRIVDLFESIEIEHQKRAGALGIAVRRERCRQPLGHAVTIGQPGQRIILREPFGIALAFTAACDVFRTPAVPGEALRFIELRLAGDFPPHFLASNCEPDVQLADRISCTEQESERPLGPVRIIILLGHEEITEGLSDGLAVVPAKLESGILGKIDQATLSVRSPEPAEPGGFETVEKFNPARRIGCGNGAKRRILQRLVLHCFGPRRPREEPTHLKLTSN